MLEDICFLSIILCNFIKQNKWFKFYYKKKSSYLKKDYIKKKFLFEKNCVKPNIYLAKALCLTKLKLLNCSVVCINYLLFSWNSYFYQKYVWEIFIPLILFMLSSNSLILICFRA